MLLRCSQHGVQRLTNRIRKTWKQHLATPRGHVVKIVTHSDAIALQCHQSLLIQDCEKPAKTRLA